MEQPNRPPASLSQVPSRQIELASRERTGWPTRGAFPDTRERLGRGGRWHRMGVRSVFALLSLLAFAGLVWQLADAAGEGLGPGDAVTALLALLLGMAVITQLGALFRSTPAGRRTLRRRQPTAQPHILLLDQVPVADLKLPARMAPGSLHLRKQARWERLAVFGTLVLGGLGLVALSAGIALGVVYGDPLSSSVLIGGLFLGLGAFGYRQLFRVCREAGWRGSPLRLARRAAFDSVRVWSGAGAGLQLALGGAAAAAVVGAGVGPLVIPERVPAVIFAYDGTAGRLYRIEDDGSALLILEGTASNVSAMATLPIRLAGPEGEPLRRGALIGVVADSSGAQQLMLIDPRERTRLPLRLLQRPLDEAGLSFGPENRLYALERDGTLSVITIRTGEITPIGSTGLEAESLDYDRRTGMLLTMAGGGVFTIDPASASVTLLATANELEAGEVCALALVSQRRALVVERTTGMLFAIDPLNGVVAGTVGEVPLPGPPCGLSVVYE